MNKPIKIIYEVGGDWESVTLINKDMNEQEVVENHHADVEDVLRILENWGICEVEKSFIDEDDTYSFDDEEYLDNESFLEEED